MRLNAPHCIHQLNDYPKAVEEKLALSNGYSVCYSGTTIFPTPLYDAHLGDFLILIYFALQGHWLDG